MTIKSLIARANEAVAPLQALDRLEDILNQLNESKTIAPAVKADILSLIDDVLELSSSMLNSTYPVSLVLKKTTNILATAQRVLLHTETHAPSRTAYGAMLPDGTLLPVSASTYDEAMSQLNALIRVGVSTNAMVVPVRISSQYILQPNAPLQSPDQLRPVQPPPPLPVDEHEEEKEDVTFIPTSPSTRPPNPVPSTTQEQKPVAPGPSAPNAPPSPGPTVTPNPNPNPVKTP